MKIRQDFVTNSSSSSYICIAKVSLTDELREYMKEEYGKFGLRLLQDYLQKGSDVKKNPYSEINDHLGDVGVEIEDDVWYLSASFVEYSTEGDTNGDDTFLYEAIPERFMIELYNGGE